MKRNPLRLPLYILQTLKQVKIFQSRRIKSTVIAQKATLLYYYETIKHRTILRKPQSGKMEPFLSKSSSKHKTAQPLESPNGLDCMVFKVGGEIAAREPS